ncbi:hypothetical protein MGSAQ_002132 [marine sediment metagenome]|uniref:Uncharacterized protein n=1 Tax=marine sediment metagenome TaxID=412755 RepID=A0A1B6NSC5_9ZZZZ
MAIDVPETIQKRDSLKQQLDDIERKGRGQKKVLHKLNSLLLRLISS